MWKLKRTNSKMLERLKINSMSKKIPFFFDSLKRALNFQESNCFAQGELNSYSCWNERKVLKDIEFQFYSVSKIRIFFAKNT